jgi:signal recognition particle subunit SRP54
MLKGVFTFEDMLTQFAQLEKMGGLGKMLGMLPGIGKMAKNLPDATVMERTLKKKRAIIQSMTRKERRDPDSIRGPHKKRIAQGSGVKIEEVNALLKERREMAQLFKSLGNMDKNTLARMQRTWKQGGNP